MSTEFNDFLERVMKYEDQKVKVATIEVEDFGEMEVQRPSASVMLEYQKELFASMKDVNVEQKESDTEKESKINLNTAEVDIEKLAKASSAFVYKCCSQLREKAIRDLYPKIAFEEIPLNLFGENNINAIAQNIYKVFKGKKVVEETTETIKN